MKLLTIILLLAGHGAIFNSEDGAALLATLIVFSIGLGIIHGTKTKPTR